MVYLIVYVFQIYKVAGLIGFFKGLGARVLYSMPATAICWSTYEFFKFVLSSKSKENYQSSVLNAKSKLSSTEQHKLYVIPEIPKHPTEIRAELTTDATLESNISGSQYTREPAISRESRELPSISGVGVYTAINMKPMHSERVFDSSIRGCNR